MAIIARRKTVKGLVAFSIRLEPDIKEKLEKIAYDEKKSLGMLVDEMLKSQMATRENKSA